VARQHINSGKIPDMTDMEIGMKEASMRDGSIALSRLLSEIPDVQNDQAIICDKCSNTMHRIAANREKHITSLLGEGTLKRDYFACQNPDCDNHIFPKDELLDISRTSFSPGVRRIMGKVAHDHAFEKGSIDLKELSGINVSAKDIERISEKMGQKIEDWESKDREQILKMNVAPTLTKDIPIMYIECDGTGVPAILKEVKNKKGKQQDGTSKTREAKLGCIFTQTSVDAEGYAVRDENSTTYVGAIEPCSEFGKRLYVEAIKRDMPNAAVTVFLGDGAEWIWNLCDKYFSGAIQIIDFYHAKEHLHTLIEALFNNKNRAYHLEKWEKSLELGEIESIVSEAKNEKNTNPKKSNLEKIVIREINYFTKNTARMRYSLFREKGLFIGSGVIEAGCKNVIGKRLKQSGMRWSVKGANSIIALRCCILSGKFDEYWDSRKAS